MSLFEENANSCLQFRARSRAHPHGGNRMPAPFEWHFFLSPTLAQGARPCETRVAEQEVGSEGLPPTQEDMASAEVSVICSRKPQLRNFTTVLECKGLSEVIQNEEPQRGVWACPRAGPLPLRAQQQGLMENCGP